MTMQPALIYRIAGKFGEFWGIVHMIRQTKAIQTSSTINNLLADLDLLIAKPFSPNARNESIRQTFPLSNLPGILINLWSI